MFCDQCGKQMPDDSVFCPNCGAKNIVSAPVQEVYVEPQPIVYEEDIKPQPVMQQPPVQQPPVQQPPVQQPIQQPMQAQPVAPAPTVDLTKPIGVLGYMGTLLLLAIPIVNLVMIFIWAFGSKVNKNRKNLAIALLIFLVIDIVLGIVFGAAAFVLIADMIEQYS